MSPDETARTRRFPHESKAAVPLGRIFFSDYLYNIGWPSMGYKDILPEMLTILPESNTTAILLASKAIYSSWVTAGCHFVIARKRKLVP